MAKQDELITRDPWAWQPAEQVMVLVSKRTRNVQFPRALLDKDDEIIALRTNIRKAAEAKVSNGTLAVTDLLREINSENKARQVKALHEVQLLMNIYQLKYTTNN